MKQAGKFTCTVFALLLSVNALLLTGCGNKEGGALQADAESRYEGSAVQAEDIPVRQEAAPEDGNGSRKTQEEYDAEDRAERAMLEEKVQEADGISEEEAIEITKNALETDLGEESEGMMLRIYDESKGWRTELCVADWSEIKEEDRGAIAYSVQFDPGDDADDWMSYHCTINAVDGSILEAYKMEFGLSDGGYCADTVYYEH